MDEFNFKTKKPFPQEQKKQQTQKEKGLWLNPFPV